MGERHTLSSSTSSSFLLDRSLALSCSLGFPNTSSSSGLSISSSRNRGRSSFSSLHHIPISTESSRLSNTSTDSNISRKLILHSSILITISIGIIETLNGHPIIRDDLIARNLGRRSLFCISEVVRAEGGLSDSRGSLALARVGSSGFAFGGFAVGAGSGGSLLVSIGAAGVGGRFVGSVFVGAGQLAFGVVVHDASGGGVLKTSELSEFGEVDLMGAVR
jgi:hypothetical protein